MTENQFPFSVLSDLEFDQLFAPDGNANICLLSYKQDLLNYIQSKSKNDLFSTLDCNYYSCDEFNSKVLHLKKNIQLSIFHLNIQSLNAKQRTFINLLDILVFEFDVIVLSEIWSNNIDFYQNLLAGYAPYYDLPT